MNLIVGIDFSKQKFDVTAIFCEDLTETKPRICNQFANDLKGFKELAKWVKKNSENAQSILFCGEKTGIYSTPLCLFLYYSGYDMWLENPYQIKLSIGLQRLKTDKADSGFIAEYAMRHQDQKVTFSPSDPAIEDMRELFQFRNDLLVEKSKMRIRMKEKKEANAKVLEIKKYCGKEIKKKDIFDYMDRAIDKIIKEIDKQLMLCEKKIDMFINANQEIKENYDIITSIKGVARMNAIALIVVTLNFKKFDYDSRKIACYYGVAPFGRYSGSSVRCSPHTSSMANKQLKALLTMAAMSAKLHCPVIEMYYKSRIARGKKPMVALNDTKNKLLHIIVAMVKNKTKYNPQYLIERKNEYNNRIS